MRSCNRQQGYALLITIVMLALLAVILGGMARRSADTALEARSSEDALRQRWAVLSCQQSLLVSAPRRFEAKTEAWLGAVADEEGIPAGWEDRPPSFETLALQLRGVQLYLRIDDEQAKVNLNEALRMSPEARLAPQAVITDTLAPAIIARPALTRPEFIAALNLQPVESWSQVLPGPDPKHLLGIRDAHQLNGDASRSDAPANRVTLWGSGRLNIYTAPDETLRRALKDRVAPTTLELILRIRRDDPGLGLQGLIDNATAEYSEDRALLNGMLTDRSRCYALWLACQAQTPDTAVTRWSLSALESTAANNTSEAGGGDRMRYYRW